MTDCNPIEQQARQDQLEALYKADGRDNPEHPMHSTYTGLAQAASTDEPAVPAPPADGEVAELVAWLRETGWLLSRRPDIQCRIELRLFARAAELLQRQALVPVADTHYEWELEDAQGEWQAGGSSNSQSDVESEGMRYLQTYAQDGPHKLIIRQHTTQTINEITNG